MSDINPLVGKRVTAVWLADDQQAIKFDVEGAEPIIARADGDCCSHSWIESLDAPDALLGVVQSVDDLDMPDLGSTAANAQDKTVGYDPECISFYGCKIVTDKGACVLDYRNESNGYYGGSLVWPSGHFYGGVFNQNESKMQWRLVVGAAHDTKEEA